MSLQEKFLQNATLEFDDFNETVKAGISNVNFQKWLDEAEKTIEECNFKTFQEQIDAFNKKLKEYREKGEVELKQTLFGIKNQEEILTQTPRIMEARTRMMDRLVRVSLEQALKRFNALSSEAKTDFLVFVSATAEEQKKVLEKDNLTLEDLGAVVMLGGTGAGYMCPHSDLDIRFVPTETDSWQAKIAQHFLRSFFRVAYTDVGKDDPDTRMSAMHSLPRLKLSFELARLYEQALSWNEIQKNTTDLKDNILKILREAKLVTKFSLARFVIDRFNSFCENNLTGESVLTEKEVGDLAAQISIKIGDTTELKSILDVFWANDFLRSKNLKIKDQKKLDFYSFLEKALPEKQAESLVNAESDELKGLKNLFDLTQKEQSAGLFGEILKTIKNFNQTLKTDFFEHMSMRCACGNQTAFEKYKQDWLEFLQTTTNESLRVADLIKFIALTHMPEFSEIAEKEFNVKEDLLRLVQYYLTIGQIDSGLIIAKPTHEVLIQYQKLISPEIFRELHDSIIFLWYLRHLTSYTNKNDKNTINRATILEIIKNTEISLQNKKEILSFMLQAVNDRLPFLSQTIFNSMHDLPDQLKSQHVENLPHGFCLQNGILYFEAEFEHSQQWGFLNQCLYYCAHYQCKLDSKIQVKLYEMVRTLTPKEFKFDPIQDISSQIHLAACADFDPEYTEKKHQILEWMSQDWLAEGIEKFYKVCLWLANSGLINALFPDMAPLKNLWSGKEHRYSNFLGETIASFQAFGEISKSKKFQPLFAPALMKLNYFNQILAFATLFHDVGLAVPNQGKKKNSPYDYGNAGHEGRSAEKFLETAQKMPFGKYVGSERGLQKVAFLIQNSHTLFAQYGLDLMRADVPSPAVLDHLKEILADNEDLIEMFLLLSMAVDNAKNPADIDQKYSKVMLLYNQFQESKQEQESVKNFVRTCFGVLLPKLEAAVQAHLEKDELKAKVTEHLKAYKEEGSLIEHTILEALTENDLKLTKLLEKNEAEMEKLILALDTQRIAKEIEVSQQTDTYGEVYVSAPEKDFEKKHKVILRMPDTADALMRFSIYLSSKGFSICAVKSIGIDNDTNLYLIEVEKFDSEKFKANKLTENVTEFCQQDNHFAATEQDCPNCWALDLIKKDLNQITLNSQETNKTDQTKTEKHKFQPLAMAKVSIKIDEKKNTLKITGQGDAKYILARIAYALHNAGLRINWASLHTSKDGKQFRDVIICESPIPEQVKFDLEKALFDPTFSLEDMEVCLSKAV